MTTTLPVKGIWAALWIPMTPKGTLDKAALSSHLQFLKQRGIHGVLALGSTGCFPYFSLDERKTILEAVAELAAPLPVIANVSHIAPRAVAELAAHAKQTGVAGVGIMAPGFFPTAQDDMLEHFLVAAEASGLPCMLYNFPELIGTRIEPQTVAAFAQRAPMLAIKQSGGEFDYHHKLVELGREYGFAVFSGADTRLPEAFAIGAAGCIGGLVNILPEAMIHLYRVCAAGHSGAIEPYASQLRELGAIIDRIPFPLNVGGGMEARGFTVGVPQSRVSDTTQARYESIVTTLRDRFAAWGYPLHQPQPEDA
ncbi:MAG: dihydrodipicolinate synthase family protein [Verrucomicrobiota bacterium JB022]|nr:dihydrodipicolinate synthase family protein [Verrucomicrobiota bacterium JB022]